MDTNDRNNHAGRWERTDCVWPCVQEIRRRLNRLQIFSHSRSLMPVAPSIIYIYLSPEMGGPNFSDFEPHKYRLQYRAVSAVVLLLQRAAADLQARVKGDFTALHQILHDEEARLLERLKKEQVEELEKVQRHLEAAELGQRELEENLRVLQQACTAADSVIVTEVARRICI